MGARTKKQYKRFLQLYPIFERYVVNGGVILLKYWLEVGQQGAEAADSLPARERKHADDDEAALARRRLVPDSY